MCKNTRKVSNSTLTKQIRVGIPRSRGVLSPSVHAARHDNLRRELLAALALFPFLQKREESGGEPVGADCVRAESVVELFFGVLPVSFEELSGRSGLV